MAAPLTTQASSPTVTPEEIQKLQITPLHKVTSIAEINEILQYNPDINARSLRGLTPVDTLVSHALKHKRSGNINGFNRYIDTAMYLVGKGGSTGHPSVDEYLFGQMTSD